MSVTDSQVADSTLDSIIDHTWRRHGAQNNKQGGANKR